MSIPRITPDIIDAFGVIAEPDVLSGTPAQNKAVFDRLVRDKVAPSLNALLDQWEASHICEAFRAEQKYHELNRVIYEGATYECLQACTGMLPSNGAYWRKLSADAMDPVLYDPQRRKTDVFTYADAGDNSTKSALRAEMSTLLERGIYDKASKKTDVFDYADAGDNSTKSALRAEMSTLLERGIYDKASKKTDVFDYADAGDNSTKSALRAEMSTLLERGIYDKASKKTDVFDYADAGDNSMKSALRAEMSTLLERGIYDKGNKKTDVFSYTDSAVNSAKIDLRAEITASAGMERGTYDPQSKRQDIYAYADTSAAGAADSAKAALRAEMSTLLERGIYDKNSKKTDIFTYADTSAAYAADGAKTALRAEMSTLLERGIYDRNSKKTDIFAYADDAADSAKTTVRSELTAAEARLNIKIGESSGTPYLGITDGTGTSLTLAEPPGVLKVGQHFQFRLHRVLYPGKSIVLTVGAMNSLPLYIPYRGASVLPENALCEVLYTGTDFSVIHVTDHAAYHSAVVNWQSLAIMNGTWDLLRTTLTNGTVFLQASASAPISTAGVVAVLPQFYRPSVVVRLASAPGNDAKISYIEARNTGAIYHVYNGIPWLPVINAAFPSEA